MCGGSIGKLFQKNSGKIFGLDIVGTIERAANKAANKAAENSPEAQQTKDDNAAQAVRKKKRLSEVLSSSENKKTTLGG